MKRGLFIIVFISIAIFVTICSVSYVSLNDLKVFALKPQTAELITNDYETFSEKIKSMNANYEISDDAVVSFEKEKDVIIDKENNYWVSSETFSRLTKIHLNEEIRLHKLNDLARENGYIFTERDVDVIIIRKFATRRLMVKTYQLYFDTYGAVEVAGYDNIYVLQYKSEAETSIAYDFYMNSDLFEQVEIDSVRYIKKTKANYENKILPLTSQGETSYKTWGAEFMGVQEYSKYLNNVLKSENNNISKLSEVVIAVIDTGIYTDHPWFQDRLLTDENGVYVGKNCTNKNSSSNYEFEDIDGHGTACSGIICEMTLPNVKILPIRIMYKNKNGDTTSTASAEMLAYDYVIKMKKKYNIVAVNMSYGSKSSIFDGINAEKIKKIYNSGVLLITSAGNECCNVKDNFPANVDCVITVSALSNEVSGLSFSDDYSNFGKGVDVCAPGTSIDCISNVGPDALYCQSGTSLAAPHIAGFIALLKSDPFNSYSNADIENILSGNYKDVDTLLDLGDQGKDIYYGYGMPILNNLIPEYVSVNVQSNLPNNITPDGYNVYRGRKKEFLLNVISQKEYGVIAIYFDGVKITNSKNKDEFRFKLYDNHEIYVDFGIKYIVNHFLEPLYDLNNLISVPQYSEYELRETEAMYGELGSLTTANSKEYPGFSSVAIEQQIIGEKTVVNAYYKRNTYKLMVITGEGIQTMSGIGEYLYGQEVKLVPEFQDGYNLVLWELKSPVDKIQNNFDVNNQTQTFIMPASDIKLTASAYYQDTDWVNILIWLGVIIAGVTLFLIITKPKKF